MAMFEEQLQHCLKARAAEPELTFTAIGPNMNSRTASKYADLTSTAAARRSLQELFAENVFAKVWRTATRDLNKNDVQASFPEYVPQEGVDRGRYVLREAEFWTCGFFPGTIFTLLERVMKFPNAVKFDGIPGVALNENLLSLGRAWSDSLHAMATRTDTHDLGFIVEPALRLDWELTGNERSLQSIIKAARSLATRYDARVGAIRSWDLISKKDVKIISMEENFIVIIDSLCNLDLLFYASIYSKDEKLDTIARTHARTLLRTHLRHERPVGTSKSGYQGQIFSTYHVANLHPRTGSIKQRMTAQGYADDSTWARGQAWAILGYAQTYMWTREAIFLDAACGLAEYFSQRLDESCKVPAWDFDAPIKEPDNPILDSSAGAIAASGMLLLSEALDMNEQIELSRGFRNSAMGIVEDLLKYSLSEEKARFAVVKTTSSPEDGSLLAVEDIEAGKSFDAILKNATANNNAGANRRYRNHGLVYADYYLAQFGNQILRMGLA